MTECPEKFKKYMVERGMWPIVGIDDEGGVYGGYDGHAYIVELTPAERRDLAQYMIERWQAFAAANAFDNVAGQG
jgi:hypothetical protein